MQRRAQKPVSIRSDKVAARLVLLTRDGRSQAIVIEEALENMPLPPQEITHAERVARVMAILKRVDRDRIPSMEEFDRREYDENGNPR